MDRTNRALRDRLSGAVLQGVAGLRRGRALWGQDLPGRRGRAPQQAEEFYGERPLRGGLLGHAHPWFELATVTRGRLLFGVGKRICRAAAGDWLVCVPDLPHGESRNSRDDDYEVLWFIRGAERLRLHVTCYEPGLGYRALCPALLGPVPARIDGLLHELARVPWDDLAVVRARLVQLTAWCLGELDAGGPAPAAAEMPAAVPPAVRAAWERLAGALQAPPAVSVLAHSLGLSPNYLSTLFHRCTGMTLRRFVQVRRIEAACGWLRQSRRPLKDIAYSLGFADAVHFCHAFRREMGMSPSTYRGRTAEIQTRDR